MNQKTLRETSRMGLIAGAVILSVCMINIVESFNQRDIISERFTLGQLLLFAGAVIVGYLAVKSLENERLPAKLIHGALAGALAGVPLLLLTLLTLVWVNIREAFINVSPDLISIITLGQENIVIGSLELIGIYGLLGIVGALATIIPDAIRRALLLGLGWAFGLGTMSEILVNILRPRLSSDMMDRIFGRDGIQQNAFIAIFLLIAIVSYWWNLDGRSRYQNIQANMTAQQSRRTSWVSGILLFLFLMILPSLLGIYLSEIFNNVGLYILMGLGLNIAVGMAGLLDLGYVTNFAVGAYIMALLTTGSEYGAAEPFSFWIALPICVAAAMFTGFFFALPVLKMRGDYLAIATLGFGEIVRILARSDALKETIGGAQGILQIQQAKIGGFVGAQLATILTPINNFLARWDLSILSGEEGEIIFGNPPQLYYLVLVGCLIMLIISRRLNNSRTGRRWMAIREDEDVAAAMGINTTNAKVIAFTLSAASGGLAGAIFAAKLGSIFPHSFQLLISVNVLSLIIVGGLGSIPGIFVGAFALIGVPELLREFGEFRLLFYGIALIVMMLVRPEGLWPSEARKRELQSSDGPPTAVPQGGD
ncbi:MAG: hypothetical protein AAF490_08135 [Chloroflexota bacterium]